MSYKTILTIVGVDGNDEDLKTASELCGQIGAHLSVLVVALAAPPPIGRHAAVVSDSWMKERQADMQRLDKRVADVTRFLAGTPLSADVASDYVELAWADGSIGRRARYADLVVMGPHLLSGESLKSETIEGVLFSSGRPLLLVPSGSRPTLTPKRVLVGWDDSLEAGRALREALPILAAAGEVHLALVDPVEGDDGHGEEPGADAAAYLARHGAKVTVDRLPKQGRSIANVLRRHAIDTSADLLVMGAYGHSRLREQIFGGVTQSMLDEPPLPILMAR